MTLARDHGKTVFVSTHVLRDVQSICDRVVLLVRGRVRLAGSVRELTGADSRALRLEGDGPLDALVAALARAGVPARRVDAAIVLEPADETALRAVWRSAHECGVAVRSLEPATRPLEACHAAP